MMSTFDGETDNKLGDGWSQTISARMDTPCANGDWSFLHMLGRMRVLNPV